MSRRRLGLWAGIFFISLFICFVAETYAVPITITATGDNYIYYYDWVAQDWEKLDEYDYDSWTTPVEVVLDWKVRYSYLVLAVKNKAKKRGSPGNPAGLLAQIEIKDDGIVLSDSSWEVYAIPNGWSNVPKFDVVDYLARSGWVSADWYASNAGQINPNHPEADGTDTDMVPFWFEENDNQPISDIDPGAQWLWTHRNFSSDMDKGALFRVRVPCPNNLSDPVVPEPTNFGLVLVGGVFLATIRRRR